MGLFSKLKASAQQHTQGGPPSYSANNNNNYAPPSPPREKQPVNPDSRPLPNGWISQFDPSSNKFFYVYTPTALRQWEHPADKPLNNRGENSSYQSQPPQSQQPYYSQRPQQQYIQQQPQYVQQPMYAQQPMSGRMGGGRMGGGMGGFGTMAAAGVGGGLLGYMVGDAIADHHSPDIIENNYYDNDTYNDYGGDMGGGGFDDGGFDDGGFEMF